MTKNSRTGAEDKGVVERPEKPPGDGNPGTRATGQAGTCPPGKRERTL